MLLSADTLFNLLLRSREELGGHDHLVPLREIAKRPADVLLAGATLVGDGRVIEVDAQLQPSLDDLS